MMLTDADKENIIKCAKKYNIPSVYFLNISGDVLLGVDGADPRVFFRFYGDLSRALSAPVDVYDLAIRSVYSGIFEKEGVKIHG
ncbi:MAG: hypothetical protein WAX07_07315 [Candidatus Altiarchaeia archaeon]